MFPALLTWGLAHPFPRERRLVKNSFAAALTKIGKRELALLLATAPTCPHPIQHAGLVARPFAFCAKVGPRESRFGSHGLIAIGFVGTVLAIVLMLAGTRLERMDSEAATNAAAKPAIRSSSLNAELSW